MVTKIPVNSQPIYLGMHLGLFFYVDLYWAFTSMYGSIVALKPKLPLLQLNINEGVHSLGAWCLARMLVEVLLVADVLVAEVNLQ